MRMRDIAQTQIRLTPQTRKRLDELVECDGRSMQKVMQDLIEYAVEHPEILRARMMERLARIEGRSGEAA